MPDVSATDRARELAARIRGAVQANHPSQTLDLEAAEALDVLASALEDAKREAAMATALAQEAITVRMEANRRAHSAEARAEAAVRDGRIVVSNRNAQMTTLCERLNRYELGLQRVMEAVTKHDAHRIARAALTPSAPALEDAKRGPETPEAGVALRAPCEGVRASALCEVSDERDRQDAKWGGVPGIDRRDDHTYAAVLTEEVGECCKAWLERDMSALREELVQTAAVAIAWIEELDNSVSSETPEGGS